MLQYRQPTGTVGPADCSPATLIDVGDQEGPKAVLSGNAMANIEKCTVIALGDVED